MAAGSFSEQLAALLNPEPQSADPEDGDVHEDTRARVSRGFILGDEDGGEEEREEGERSALRKRSDSPLGLTDTRYAGARVSRKQLLGEEEEGEEEWSDEKEEDEEEARGATDEGSEEEATGSDDGEGGSEEEEDGGSMDEDGGLEAEQPPLRAFSGPGSSSSSAARAEAVRRQLGLWEQLLGARIRVQKALLSANQLPAPPAAEAFQQRGGAEMETAMSAARLALGELQGSLLDLQERLLRLNPETKAVVKGEGGVVSRKRPLDPDDSARLTAKRFSTFEPFRSATLRKWHDRTRLAGSRGRGFGAFERGVEAQVQAALADPERLRLRTQTRRSEYRVLGTAEPTGGAVEPNQHIFDDDDFYQQLLRELIERRGGGGEAAAAAGRRWLSSQRVRKNVDTRASKGRKVRFQAHAKLLSFMAPVDKGGMCDEARSELFRGLFSTAPP